MTAHCPTTAAIVPIRDGLTGKTRLSEALDTSSRRRLVAVLARHVVGVLVASGRFTEIAIVTADLEFARSTLSVDLDVEEFPDLAGQTEEVLAERIRFLAQEEGHPGLNGAIDTARAELTGRVERLVVVHADLPALTAQDITAVLNADGDVVLATDRAQAGTNILAVDVDQPFVFRFGEASMSAHLAEAGRRRLRTVVVRRPGTAVDLDTLSDWAQLPDEVRARVARQTRELRLSGRLEI